MTELERRLAALGPGGQGLLAGGRRGLEKEALRVGPDGRIAGSAHPPALGSALTHPYITTDYSEALLEFVTPPVPSSAEALEFLADLHAFAASRIGEELLWAASMPCVLGGDEAVPLAQYGSSNLGRMKTVYRRGLGYRYGRMMQTISGVHFNYSLPQALWPVLADADGLGESPDACRSRGYMALVRNFRRHGWLVLYLFGASPAVCRSFFAGRHTELEAFDAATVHTPWATSLRMSDLGYQNENQAQLDIPVNTLEGYIDGLLRAMRTPSPEYERIGVRVNGEYRQLSANLLQIENEFYSLIRPKRVARSGERPTAALRRGGVEYVEVRALDVSAFEPLGVGASQLRFLEAFLIWCLLEESPPMDASEQAAAEHNQRRVAWEGRRPGLMLKYGGGEEALSAKAAWILDGVEAVAERLDAGSGGAYGRAVLVQRQALREPGLLPSARMLAEMRQRGESFVDFALRMSAAHQQALRERPLSPACLAHFNDVASGSLQRQRELEAADTVGFDEHLAAWFAD